MSDFVQGEESVFLEAVEMEDPLDRARYLEQACAGNAALRASVEQLIAMHDTADGFLDTPAIGSRRSACEERPGDVIDRFRLEERIGEGAFGAVWKARQEKPVHRAVALKILRSDLGSKRIIARFESERQTLALMNHPNIATVLDAGTTASGRPYFAMELVEGEAIDAYCDSHRLDVRQRVELMKLVCKAVHHAHQKGIVHRDLKPSNVLVANVDGSPCVKIIDFGIAKALREDVSTSAAEVEGSVAPTSVPSTAATNDHQVIGTPYFMSPEQFRGQLDIDTRADVYALGGIAYHLMTGCPPHYDDGRQTPAQIKELVCGSRRTVAPSKRLANEGDDTRANRIRSSQLRGDLDAIILKALQKDPAQRYQSVDELANDLDRHLELRPVVARHATPGYMTARFVARHRGPALAALVATVALLIGSITATVGWIQAESARQTANKESIRAIQSRVLAEQEAENARQVSQLLREMLGASDPQRGLPATYSIAQQLDVFAEKLSSDQSPVSSPQVRADLLRTIGRSYLSLRSMSKAEEHLREALALRREMFAADDPAVLESRVDLAYLFRASTSGRELRTELDDLIPTLRTSSRRDLYIEALTLAGTVQMTKSQEESLATAQHALQAAREHHGDDHRITLVQRTRVAFQQATLTDDDQELARWEAEAHEAFDRLREKWPRNGYDIATAQLHLTKILIKRNKLQAAESQLRELIEAHRKLQGQHSVFASRESVVLAQVLHLQGRDSEARELTIELVEAAEKHLGENAYVVERHFNLLSTILRSSDPEQASELLRRSIAVQRSNNGDNLSTVRSFRARARRLLDAERYDDAELYYLEMLEIHRVLGNRMSQMRVRVDLSKLRSARAAAMPPQERGTENSTSIRDADP